MQTLSVRTTDDNGMSFELYVDNVRLCELIGGDNPAFPYWIVEDDLPHFPPQKNVDSSSPTKRIICVCSCGEYGCGHTHCTVDKGGDFVVFRDFAPETSETGRNMQFTFSRRNYDEVVSEIVSAASKQKGETPS